MMLGRVFSQKKFRSCFQNKPQGSWYGPNTRWDDQVRHLLYDPRPSTGEMTDVLPVVETVQEEASDVHTKL